MKRYDFNAVSSGYGGATELDREESPDGDYVLYSDAAKLAKAYRYQRAAIRLEYFGNSFDRCSKLGRKLWKKVIWLKLESHKLYSEVME